MHVLEASRVLKYVTQPTMDSFWRFQKITHLDKKCGGAERSADQMQAFRNALDACDLLDLGFSGLTGPHNLLQWSKSLNLK